MKRLFALLILTALVFTAGCVKDEDKDKGQENGKPEATAAVSTPAENTEAQSTGGYELDDDVF